MKISFPLLILTLSFTLLLSSCNFIAKNKIIGIWSIQEPIVLSNQLVKASINSYQIRFTNSKAYLDYEVQIFGQVSSYPTESDYSIDGDKISFADGGGYFTIENNYHVLTTDITSQGINVHLELYKVTP
jgi:hypothetical protein